MRRAKTSCIVAFCIALPAVSFILATAAGSILFTTIPPQDTSSKNLANTESSVQDFRKDIPETQEAAGIIQQKREIAGAELPLSATNQDSRDRLVYKIHDAAMQGDLAKVKALLKEDPDLVAGEYNNGMTPLHRAAEFNHKDVVELLLASKADVNAKDDNGRTPLNIAAQEGHKDEVELLLANRANVNANAQNGWTPLHWAVEKGNKDMAELLLANKADVNARASKASFIPIREPVSGKREISGGWTPLLLAANGGYRDIAELLLANKSDVNAANSFGATPLLQALVKGHKDVAELLLAHGADVKAKANDGMTLLYRAAGAETISLQTIGGTTIVMDKVAGSPCKDEAEWLMGYEVKANATNGWTPLHLAAQKGFKNMVELMIAKGADVNAKAPILGFINSPTEPGLGSRTISSGFTPLLMAGKCSHKDIVELMLSHGADVNANTSNGETPLKMALGKGYKDVAEQILAKGADINAKNSTGRTPLYMAMVIGHKDEAEWLLAHGADINAKDSNGYTPFHIVAAQSTIPGPSQGSAKQPQDFKDIAEWLLAHGAEFNAKNNFGQTPLHLAAGRGRKEAAEWLLVHGADVNAKDTNGYTPLHEVVVEANRAPQDRKNCKDMVEWLLAHGADVNAKDNNGMTPMRLADFTRIRGSSATPKPVVEAVEFMRRHGGHE
jgi:ankyrin repeat protein